VRFSERAGIVPELGRREAERLHQHYTGPEHLLLGLLRDAEDPRGPGRLRR
jgi:Clp amino terminal domain, pathogenicity island component